MDSIAVITGPTATGKTALGIALARAFGGEIVSADSMQIYRRMDIGTAKPTPAERAAAVHHMIDVADPDEDFSVSRYVEMADRCVQDILSRGRLPVVVGGTGLYVDSLVRGRGYEAPLDPGLRAELGARYDEIGGEAFRAELARLDPMRAAKLASGDKKRLVRAMEVCRLTGKTMTELDELDAAREPRYSAAKIVLDFASREDLYRRIDARVDEMVRLGLEGEVRAMLDSGVRRSGTAMQAIGYKEMAAAIDGEMSVAAAVEEIKRASRRYAKRQLTWLRRDGEALRISWPGPVADIERARLVSTEFLAARGIK